MTRLLLVGVDGLRLDVLDLDRLPALRRMLDGACSVMTMAVPTISGPGWSTLLTGAAPAEHAVVDNRFIGHRLALHPDLLTRAWLADPTRTTFAAAAWPPLVGPDVSFVHWSSVDEAGHLFGARSAEYQAAAERVDAHLGRLLGAVEHRHGSGERLLAALGRQH